MGGFQSRNLDLRCRCDLHLGFGVVPQECHRRDGVSSTRPIFGYAVGNTKKLGLRCASYYSPIEWIDLSLPPKASSPGAA